MKRKGGWSLSSPLAFSNLPLLVTDSSQETAQLLDDTPNYPQREAQRKMPTLYMASNVPRLLACASNQRKMK